MNNRFKKVLLVLSFFVFVVPVLIIVAIQYQDSKEQISCTMEAKLCPDGSYVGRTGSKCEFAKCPTVTEKDNDFVKINQKISINGIYITPLEVVSDSRCPKKVQCVWAGTVSVKVIIEKEDIAHQTVIELGKPINFGGENIYLESVLPEKTETEIDKNEYKFVFKVL